MSPSVEDSNSNGCSSKPLTTPVKLILPQIPRSNRPESALNRVLRADFYKRRLIPNESTYIRRFKNRDPSRLRVISGENRLKQFQVENDSQKGVPFLADHATDL